MINRQSSNGYIPSNDREQQNYLGGYGLSFRNIEEHKHIDKRLYTYRAYDFKYLVLPSLNRLNLIDKPIICDVEPFT